MKNNPGIKIKKVAELRKKSESTAAKQLTELKKKQFVEYRGANKTGVYYVKWAVVLFRGKIWWHLLEHLAEESGLMECKDGRYEVMKEEKFLKVESW